MNRIPYPQACPECGSLALSVQDRHYCPSERCELYGEVIAE